MTPGKISNPRVWVKVSVLVLHAVCYDNVNGDRHVDLLLLRDAGGTGHVNFAQGNIEFLAVRLKSLLPMGINGGTTTTCKRAWHRVGCWSQLLKFPEPELPELFATLIGALNRITSHHYVSPSEGSLLLCRVLCTLPHAVREKYKYDVMTLSHPLMSRKFASIHPHSRKDLHCQEPIGLQ